MIGIETILNWLYPKKCAICGGLLNINDKNHLCGDCKGGFTNITGPLCPKCGAPFFIDEFCFYCKNKHFSFDRNISLFLYDEYMLEAIHAFKYGKKLSQGMSLSLLSSESLLKYNIDFKEFDFLIPVPIHKNRMRERGFNQSEIIAKYFSKYLGVPLNVNAIKRTKDTKPQSKLDYHQRQTNVTNIFKLNPKSNISNKNIIIVDDIFTSGSTLNSISELLKENGANYILTITLSMAIKLAEEVINASEVG